MRSVDRERLQARWPTAAQLGAQVVDDNHQNIPLLRLGLPLGVPFGKPELRVQVGLGTEDTLMLLLLLRARRGGHRHRRSQERQGHGSGRSGRALGSAMEQWLPFVASSGERGGYAPDDDNCIWIVLDRSISAIWQFSS